MQNKKVYPIIEGLEKIDEANPVKNLKVGGKDYVLITNKAMKWFTLTPASNYKKGKIVNPSEKHWEFEFKKFKTEADCIEYINSKIGKVEEAALGTEVGLPIDKENCEGTDASNIDTPKDAPKNTNSGVDTTLHCPKCNSENVTTDMNGKCHCIACDYSWDMTEPTNEGKYVKGKTYITDDGMKYTVKSVDTKNGIVKIFDENEKREYKVEISDLELCNSKEC